MAFDNKSIKAPIKDKPHIVKVDGWWRVSELTRENRPAHQQRWFKAHSRVMALNFKISVKGMKNV